MPIYEYKCENGHVFDVMQKMSEDPLSDCVECGAPVRKILQPVGISFKGSGFYSTDYNAKKGPKEPTSTNGDSKTETKGEPKDKKPAEKSASSSQSTGTKD